MQQSQMTQRSINKGNSHNSHRSRNAGPNQITKANTEIMKKGNIQAMAN